LRFNLLSSQRYTVRTLRRIIRRAAHQATRGVALGAGGSRAGVEVVAAPRVTTSAKPTQRHDMVVAFTETVAVTQVI